MTKTESATFASVTRTENAIYALGTCGKVSAEIIITENSIRVICRNASHRVWKGYGRSFPNVSEALNAYKKPEMKAIILAADRLNH